MDFVFEDSTETATIERDIVPAGIHEMTIRHAEEGPNQYKVTDTNPEGMCLKLRLATVTGDYKFVFDDLPQHLGWRAKQLAEALGIEPVNGRLALTPDALVNQTLSVEVSHYTSKAGKVSATVKRYVPAAKTAKPKAAAKPVAKKAAPPADEFPDDIPF